MTMKKPSIGFRLAAWYFLVFAAGLTAFSILAWFAMRTSLYHAIDDELQDRVHGVRSFMDQQISALSLPEIRDEFREHSVLGPGGDLFQVCDATGQWLYRSVPLEKANVPIALPAQVAKNDFRNVQVNEHLLRFYSEHITVAGKSYTVQVASLMDEDLAALARFRTILLAATPLLLIIASAGGYWLSTRALAPVDRISTAARRIGIENLAERLDVPKTGDELQRLSETLNEMFSGLEASVHRIRQFTADASHELRAPLSLIRTTAEVAVQRDRAALEYRDALHQILEESERTSHVLESLMMLARADAGKEALDLALVDFSAIAREAGEQGEKLARSAALTFNVTLPPVPIPVMADKEALRRALLILLDNAVHYTPQGGTVTIAVTNQNGFAVVSVKDTGIGIAASELPYVFDRFWRADKARSRDRGGAGLGLSIARWIVEAHDGRIEVVSEPARGSCFTISIPLCA